MAYFDPERREVVLRIVYDGPATAGKTQNLRALHAAAQARSRGAVVVPAETKTGRTLYFDWLELLAGQLDDWPLRCQLLTVPGQLAHAERRFQLLREIDAVVLVCESSAPGVRAARVAWEFLGAALASSGNVETPIVIQANKQDLPSSLSVSEVLAGMNLKEACTVVAASAKTQEGVLATFLTALALGRDRVRDMVRTVGPEVLPPPLASAEVLYEAMLASERGASDPEVAAALEAALAAVERQP